MNALKNEKIRYSLKIIVKTLKLNAHIYVAKRFRVDFTMNNIHYLLQFVNN